MRSQAMALSLFVALAGALSGCSPAEKEESTKKPLKPPISELQIDDRKPGTGLEVGDGDWVAVYYKGYYPDDQQFQALEHGSPLTFKIGAGAVIKGWEKGLIGMKEGGERYLGVPYPLAYGEDGKAPLIPRKCDLYFDIQLVKVIKKDHIEQPYISDSIIGKGPVVEKGDRAHIDYVVTDLTGQQVDSSEGRKPAPIVVGKGVFIDGVERGLIGMREGGKRVLTMAPEIAFQGINQALGSKIIKVEVELRKVEKKGTF